MAGRARKNSVRNISMRAKLLVSMLVLSLAMTVYTAVMSYQLAERRITDISMRLAEQNIVMAVDALNVYAQDLQEESSELFWNDTLRELISLPQAPAGISLDVYNRRMKNALTTGIADAVTSEQERFFSFVSVYLANGFSLSSQYQTVLPFGNYEQCLQYFHLDELIDSSPDGYVSSQWRLCWINQGDEAVPVFIRFIYESITMEKVGLIVFGVREKLLWDTYSNFAPEGFLMDADGHMVSSGYSEPTGTVYDLHDLLKAPMEQSGQGSITYTDPEKGKSILSFMYVPGIQSYLVVPFSYTEVVKERGMGDYIRSIVLIGAVGLAAAALLAMLISRGLSRSVTGLMSFIKKVESGDDNLRYEDRSHDEIDLLGNKLNDMLDEIQRTNAQREQDLKANQLMELQMMQQQINPHLLYNTLDSVLWGLQQHRFDDATSLLYSLSEFFKLSLSHGRYLVPLRDELTLIRHYLSIQHLARQKEFRLATNIDDALLDISIIKLTIQPLVENAIVHGYSGYRDDGEITINASKMNGMTVIEVIDDGIGMLEDEVQEVNTALKSPTLPEGYSHFGLYNINRRIQQSCGSEYGLQVESEVGSYTKITMRLPDRPFEKSEE